ncbi:MAG: hypothetical protein ACPGYX_01445 [Oceanobacter sp.]
MTALHATARKYELTSLAPGSTQLEARITASLNELSDLLELPARRAVSELSAFVNHYASYLSNEMAVMGHSQERAIDYLQAGLEDLCVKEVGATHYLHWSGDLPQARPDSLLQLCMTYLVGRTLGKASEQALAKGDLPLTRFDLTTSNQMLATLLGQNLAQKIHQLSEELLISVGFNSTVEQAFDRKLISDSWPCLASQQGLNARIKG